MSWRKELERRRELIPDSFERVTIHFNSSLDAYNSRNQIRSLAFSLNAFAFWYAEEGNNPIEFQIVELTIRPSRVGKELGEDAVWILGDYIDKDLVTFQEKVELAPDFWDQDTVGDFLSTPTPAQKLLDRILVQEDLTPEFGEDSFLMPLIEE